MALINLVHSGFRNRVIMLFSISGSDAVGPAEGPGVLHPLPAVSLIIDAPLCSFLQQDYNTTAYRRLQAMPHGAAGLSRCCLKTLIKKNPGSWLCRHSDSRQRTSDFYYCSAGIGRGEGMQRAVLKGIQYFIVLSLVLLWLWHIIRARKLNRLRARVSVMWSDW